MSFAQPRKPKMRTTKGMTANRTPASLGEFAKLDVMAYQSILSFRSTKGKMGLTAMTVESDQIKYPSFSPKAVRIAVISLLARVLISPGPTFSKNAAS
jgi:hypothetical protein